MKGPHLSYQRERRGWYVIMITCWVLPGGHDCISGYVFVHLLRRYRRNGKGSKQRKKEGGRKGKGNGGERLERKGNENILFRFQWNCKVPLVVWWWHWIRDQGRHPHSSSILKTLSRKKKKGLLRMYICLACMLNILKKQIIYSNAMRPLFLLSKSLTIDRST